MDLSMQFPVLNNYTYLNTAGSGILSRDLMQWRREHDGAFYSNGSAFRLENSKFIQEGRNTIAEFFNGDVSSTYLVPNFSHGFNIVLEGLGGKKRFVLLQEDYPSINYPVLSRGHECAYAKVDEHLEQNILEVINSFKPNVLALSLVQYSNGIMIDFEFLRRLKLDYPELLIIADGTQFCGTAPFNFKKSGIDVLIASGYKWLLGGYGNGFVLLAESTCGMLYQDEKKAALPNEGFLQGRNTLSLFFEPGHLDTLNFGTLFKSIDYLQEQRLENIQKRINRLASKARSEFTKRDLLTDAVKNRRNDSGIFNIMLSPAKINQLHENNIVFTARGVGARVSFHFYNSEDDLDRLLALIDK